MLNESLCFSISEFAANFAVFIHVWFYCFEECE